MTPEHGCSAFFYDTNCSVTSRRLRTTAIEYRGHLFDPFIRRKANRFNVENRAQLIISKDKPTPAPQYPSTVKQLERISKEFPNIAEEQATKDVSLDERLRQVFVRSHNTQSEPTIKTDPNRPLPLVRGNMEEQEFGFHEPKTVPRGRCSLRQALQFINDHETDPVKWSCGNIASEYHINQDMLEKILMFYRTFHVYIPESKNSRGQILVKPPVQPTLK